jgi:hypothetical protein
MRVIERRSNVLYLFFIIISGVEELSDEVRGGSARLLKNHHQPHHLRCQSEPLEFRCLAGNITNSHYSDGSREDET